MELDSIERFWDKYIDKIKRYEVFTKCVRWYVKRAEEYIKAHSELRLAQHSEESGSRGVRVRPYISH